MKHRKNIIGKSPLKSALERLEENKLVAFNKVDEDGNMFLPHSFDMANEISNNIHNDLMNQFDDAIIEGLKRKGFEFKNKLKLETFVKERCRCEDNIYLKERTYYVDDIPFFLHNYKFDFNIETIHEDRKTTMSANSGSFAYL